jgi:hypothetical protein
MNVLGGENSMSRSLVRELQLQIIAYPPPLSMTHREFSTPPQSDIGAA